MHTHTYSPEADTQTCAGCALVCWKRMSREGKKIIGLD